MSNDKHTQSDYFTFVSELASEIRSEAKEYGNDESDVLAETVDGCEWVIYTRLARKVLEYSANDCAIFEQCGPQEWTDWSTAFSQSAFFAMCADVQEALDELP